MEERARAELKELIRRSGNSLVDEPQHVAALMRNALGDEYRREISVLEIAAEEGVPRALLDSRVPASALVPELESRLARDRGLAADASRWAVESWASALGITVPSRSATRTRVLLSVVGSAGLIVASFSTWGFDHKAYRIGADVLLTENATTTASFTTSIGMVTLALGALALLGLIPRRGWPTTLAGLGGLAIFVLFLVTHSIRADFPGTELNYGVLFLLSSAVAIPAGFIGTRERELTGPRGSRRG